MVPAPLFLDVRLYSRISPGCRSRWHKSSPVQAASVFCLLLRKWWIFHKKQEKRLPEILRHRRSQDRADYCMLLYRLKFLFVNDVFDFLHSRADIIKPGYGIVWISSPIYLRGRNTGKEQNRLGCCLEGILILKATYKNGLRKNWINLFQCFELFFPYTIPVHQLI